MKIILLLLVTICFSQNNRCFCIKGSSQQCFEEKELNSISLEEKHRKTLSRDVSSSNYVKYNMVTENLSYESIDTNRSEQNEEEQQFLNLNSLFQKKSEIKNRTIIGSDDRIQILTPKVDPYLPTVLLKSTYRSVYNNISGNYFDRVFRGTGFIVGPNILLTAGHNVFHDVTSIEYENNEPNSEWNDNIDNPFFADKLEIFAGANGPNEMTTPYSYYAKAVKINIATSYFNNIDFDYDWALLELDRNIGDRTGCYGLISNTYCWYESSTLYGYPGDKDYTMWESPGQITYSTIRQYTHTMDTSPGNSGSPIFINHGNETYVCGIHTHKKNQYSNGGTILNNLILNLVQYLALYAKQENSIGSIQKTDYGYPDNYTTSYSDSAYFANHTSSSGLSFQTKRYRTGFIHNEYVVMSDIRSGIYNAFLTYQFYQPVTKIEVDLSHWRELEHEWTYETETICRLRVGTRVIANLLSDEINLTTNRNFPIKYTFIMPYPIYTFTFEMNALLSHSNNDNRGRVCIGQLDLYYESN